MASGGPDGDGVSKGLLNRRGGGRGKTQRLPSIRPQRDLTLGGVKKKTFTPNIPSRRTKEDDLKMCVTVARHNFKLVSEAGEPIATTSKGKSDRFKDRGRGRGRGRGRQEREVIQSHSIFEQGPTDGVKSRHGGSSYSGGGSVDRKETTSRVSMKREKRDAGETKRILDDILRDDFVDGGKADDEFTPVRLPLAKVKKEIKQEADIKPALDIKREPLDDDDDEMGADPISSISDVTQRLSDLGSKKTMTAAEFFMSPDKKEDGELLIMQLPDVMPGDRPTQEDTDRKTTDKETPPKPEDELSKKLGLCSLGEFSEGLIGKLQVLKSGRTRLVFGDGVSLDVTMGTPAGFLQDLASVRVNGDDGDIMVLGHVDHKLVCVPDFECFLDDT